MFWSVHQFDPFLTYRYCPSRWNQPKLGSFDRSSLKREAQLSFVKIRLSSILWEPFKFTATSWTLISNWAPNWQWRSKAHTASTAPLVLHGTRIGKGAMKNFVSIGNFGINFYWLSSFLFHFFTSLCWMIRTFVNCAKDCLTGIGYGAMVLKTTSISSFSNCQRRNKDLAHLTITEGLSSKAKMGAFSIVNCGIKKNI